MINKAKLALIAAVAAVSVSAPALAQASVHDARRNGLHAQAMEPHHARRTTLDPYAMEPRAQSDFESDSPAATGGGSLGYNQLLTVEP
jgi:hypothetical protein